MFNGTTFFERVAIFEKNMKDMDLRDFSFGIRIISRGLYTEVVGQTAVRKSSKIENIISEFVERMD